MPSCGLTENKSSSVLPHMGRPDKEPGGNVTQNIWTEWLRQTGQYGQYGGSNEARPPTKPGKHADCNRPVYYTMITQVLAHWSRDKMSVFHPDDIFKCIFLNEYVWILLNISLKFVPKVRINNIPALDQIMAWRRPGDKPLSEPMMVWLLTHICVTRPQWVNSLLEWILND